jgi:hypothetical protein
MDHCYRQVLVPTYLLVSVIAFPPLLLPKGHTPLQGNTLPLPFPQGRPLCFFLAARPITKDQVAI